MSDDYGRDWLVGDDLDAACVESIKRRMAVGAVDSRIMVRAGWVDALRQRAEAAERERDAAREQVAALREAAQTLCNSLPDSELELAIEAWSWTNVKCVMGKRDALRAALAA